MYIEQQTFRPFTTGINIIRHVLNLHRCEMKRLNWIFQAENLYTEPARQVDPDLQ